MIRMGFGEDELESIDGPGRRGRRFEQDLRRAGQREREAERGDEQVERSSVAARRRSFAGVRADRSVTRERRTRVDRAAPGAERSQRTVRPEHLGRVFSWASGAVDEHAGMGDRRPSDGRVALGGEGHAVADRLEGSRSAPGFGRPVAIPRRGRRPRAWPGRLGRGRRRRAHRQRAGRGCRSGRTIARSALQLPRLAANSASELRLCWGRCPSGFVGGRAAAIGSLPAKTDSRSQRRASNQIDRPTGRSIS